MLGRRRKSSDERSGERYYLFSRENVLMAKDTDTQLYFGHFSLMCMICCTITFRVESTALENAMSILLKCRSMHPLFHAGSSP